MASVSEMAVAKAMTNKKPKPFPKKEDPDEERTLYLEEGSMPTMGMYKQMAKQNITIERIKRTAPPPPPLPPFAPPPLEVVAGPPHGPITKADYFRSIAEPVKSKAERDAKIRERESNPEMMASRAYDRQREGKASAKDLEVIAKFEAYLKGFTVRR
jgi:hypothetical protein